jgi:hypothetical protein
MTTSNLDTQETAADPQAGDPTPAANQPGKSDVLMGRVLQSIETAARGVPGFVLPHKAGRRSIYPYFGIAEEFIFDAITAVEETPAVGLGLLNPVDARERMERNRAIRAIVPRVRLIAEALQYTADVDEADLAQRAQKIYGAVKTLARDPKATIVAVRARIMKTSRGVVRKKKSTRKEASAAQQQPHSIPPPNDLQEAA